ncbi:MAG: nuclease-related domain-containing protein [Candidatus Bathyarchaeia archaeon]|nr:NERD domain-containing protein [Candidatus Bathyarchaeota archaeon]
MKDPAFKAFLKALLELSIRRNITSVYELQSMAKIPREKAIIASRHLEEKGIISMVDDGIINLEDMDRIGLSLLAIEEGIDVEVAARHLSWRDFERFVGDASRAENFKVLNNIHLINKSRRHQIDLLAVREPLILSIDCKHWKFKLSPSKISKAAKAHVERTQALAEHMGKRGSIEGLSLPDRRFYILPVIALLMEPYNIKVVSEVPVVPLLKFRDFLRNVPPVPGLEPIKYIPVDPGF